MGFNIFYAIAFNIFFEVEYCIMFEIEYIIFFDSTLVSSIFFLFFLSTDNNNVEIK